LGKDEKRDIDQAGKLNWKFIDLGIWKWERIQHLEAQFPN
jgi:hypothetical protein